MMDSQKVAHPVIPAKVGTHSPLKSLDSGLRRNDGEEGNGAFYEFINSGKTERDVSRQNEIEIAYFGRLENTDEAGEQGNRV